MINKMFQPDRSLYYQLREFMCQHTENGAALTECVRAIGDCGVGGNGGEGEVLESDSRTIVR